MQVIFRINRTSKSKIILNLRIANYLVDEHTVRIFSAPYFIGTKLEAFKSPDRKDNNKGIYSTDFEDIVFVLENRLSIWDELVEAPAALKEYLKEEFRQLLQNPLFVKEKASCRSFVTPDKTSCRKSQLVILCHLGYELID